MHAQSQEYTRTKTDYNSELTDKPVANMPVHTGTNGLEHLTLTTQNSETGRAQITLLPYCRENNVYIVAATSSERGTKPNWFLNLKKEPLVQLGISGVQFYAQARTPTGRERISLLKATRDLVPNMTNKIPRETCLVAITPMW